MSSEDGKCINGLSEPAQTSVAFSAKIKLSPKKSWFFFTYRGEFPSQVLLIDYLGAKSFEMFSDSSGLKYCLLNTKIQTRDESVHKVIVKWNKENPKAVVYLQPLPNMIKPVMSFEKSGSETFEKSKYVKEMKDQKLLASQGKNSTYVSWRINKDGVLALNGSSQNSEEFDVVKKRRMMDQALEDTTMDCPAALQRFEDFESHVLPALLRIDAEDKQIRHDEMLQMELDLCSGVRSLAGGVYVAVSKAVKFPKIGATRKGDPTPRLQALSRHVPSPFQAVFWVPTVMPFKVESEIHKHFDAFRLRERGACTEFFDVDVSAIGDFLKANYAVVGTGVL